MTAHRSSPVERLVELCGLEVTGPSTAPPFFIVGAARSGTTLLRVLLDSHPRISVGPETNVLHHWIQAVADAKTLHSYPYLDDELLAYPAAALELLHRRYMAERGKVRWGEKTPNYTVVIDEIMRVWPDALFVHCIRDGRDVVCSMMDRWGWRAAPAARQWRQRVESTLEQVEKLPPNRRLEVRYEDLVMATEPVVRRVLDFLGEPWDPAVLQQANADHHGVADDVPEALATVSAASVERWRTELGPLDRLVVNRVAGPTLRRLGYR